MAEARQEDNDMMSDDIQRGPDVPATLCDPCQEEFIRVSAESFFVDCNDYLCCECLNIHKRAKPCRNHILVDKDNMPSRKPKDTFLEYCGVHKDECIKLFCKTHNKTVCQLCKLAEHRKCNEVYTIDDVCKSVFSSTEFKQVKGKLSRLKHLFESCSKDTDENVLKVNCYHTLALEEFTKTLSALRQRDLDLMKSIDIACKTSASTISSFLASLDTLEEQGNSAKAFLEQKKADSLYNHLQSILKSALEDNEITKYRFLSESASQIIGNVVKPIAYVGSWKIESITDLRDCKITGINLLNDENLVVVDHNNNKIKIIEIATKIVCSELNVDGIPWDLVTIDEETIAVTTYNTKAICMFKFTDTLQLLNVVQKGEFSYCQGIAYDKQTLIVSYYDPVKIQLLRKDGTVESTIDKVGKDGTKRFGVVKYIAVSEGTLYLSQETDNKIIRMTKDGTVLSAFQHKNLRKPRGITNGADGKVYVCSMGSNAIFEVTADLSEGRIILDEQNGISRPHSIAYNSKKSELYIGSDGKNEIQVFYL